MNIINKKSACGGNQNADFINPYNVHSKSKGKKIKLSFPEKANPLFCSFDKKISNHINSVGGFCHFLYSKNIDAYDYQFCALKEVWIFHLLDEANSLLLRLAYTLLRHGANKIQIIQYFPIEETRYVKR